MPPAPLSSRQIGARPTRSQWAEFARATGAYGTYQSQGSGTRIHYFVPAYRIAGKFGEVFNLANWRACGKSPN